ncbi:MAG: PAS domain-containing sensor histidine kinase [Rubrivivax sp.]|nr:PAS domain-containing sensor histidine kinase [Rubrivivax sp.]
MDSNSQHKDQVPAPARGRRRRTTGGAHDHIIHAAREAIVTIDEQQRIVMVNPAAERLFASSAAQMLGSALEQFIPQRHRQGHAEQVRRFGAGRRAERPMAERRAVTGLRADGSEFPLEATISRADFDDPQGPRRLYTALLRDLSAEQALRAEYEMLKRRFQTVLELAPVAIWIVEGDTIVFANRACGELFGTADCATLRGRSIFSLLSPPSHAALRQSMAQAQQGRVRLINEGIVRLDGGLREVEVEVAALPDHGRLTLQMAISDVTLRRQEEADAERSRQELRWLSASLVEAREDERQRIARELHDELGQRLSALKMELSSLGGRIGGAGADDSPVQAMLSMLDETVASVRRIAADLRPLMLDDLGLNAAIEWLARESARRAGIEVTVRLGQQDPPLDARASTAVYRMVQEALTNVLRHAQATDVAVSLLVEGAELVLTVQDNGIGFPLSAMRKQGSFGLMGIRERAYLLGGRMVIDNPPGQGGCITVHLPLKPLQQLQQPSDAAAPGWPVMP